MLYPNNSNHSSAKLRANEHRHLGTWTQNTSLHAVSTVLQAIESLICYCQTKTGLTNGNLVEPGGGSFYFRNGDIFLTVTFGNNPYGLENTSREIEQAKIKNWSQKFYLSDLISSQHNYISPFMKALGGSQVTNSLERARRRNGKLSSDNI